MLREHVENPTWCCERSTGVLHFCSLLNPQLLQCGPAISPPAFQSAHQGGKLLLQVHPRPARVTLSDVAHGCLEELAALKKEIDRLTAQEANPL